MISLLEQTVFCCGLVMEALIASHQLLEYAMYVELAR